VIHASEGRPENKAATPEQLRAIFDATLVPYADKKQSVRTQAAWHQSPLSKSQSCTNLLEAFTVAKGHHYCTYNFRWYRYIKRPGKGRLHRLSVTAEELGSLHTTIETLPCSAGGLGQHLQISYLNDIKDFIRVLRSRAQPSCHNKPKS